VFFWNEEREEKSKMKRLLLFFSVILIIFLGSSCLYVISVPIPVGEGLIEPIEFELPGSILPLSYYAFGTETVPSLDEIIQEAEKETQLNLPDNFVITGMEIKARVDGYQRTLIQKALLILTSMSSERDIQKNNSWIFSTILIQ
jgi:hypothetical protein